MMGIEGGTSVSEIDRKKSQCEDSNLWVAPAVTCAVQSSKVMAHGLGFFVYSLSNKSPAGFCYAYTLSELHQKNRRSETTSMTESRFTLQHQSNRDMDPRYNTRARTMNPTLATC